MTPDILATLFITGALWFAGGVMIFVKKHRTAKFGAFFEAMMHTFHVESVKEMRDWLHSKVDDYVD